MEKSIENNLIKITIATLVVCIITISTFVWQVAMAYAAITNHEKRIADVEIAEKESVTKDDLKNAVANLKDYINKH